ncbi:charged multivesicular body protein 1b-2 [Mesocricetus auratus]|uniref:Charged multivesicular body protein 1b-2 n=1 Tax=Mesocricetus auratus TaxID=10036 RepID=A0ABM2XGZ3_MESAU|nr:charged multivesicular body protein 1b-2 [Mesocricetus auratus]
MSNLEKQLFNLKLAAQELKRNAKKCDEEVTAEKEEIKMSQVDMLLQELADEVGLDLSVELPQVQIGSADASFASMEQPLICQFGLFKDVLSQACSSSRSSVI